MQSVDKSKGYTTTKEFDQWQLSFSFCLSYLVRREYFLATLLFTITFGCTSFRTSVYFIDLC